MEVILAIITVITVMKYTTKLFFTDSADLLNCLQYWFKPARSRFMFEQWDGEFWRELRLFIWLLLGGLSGYGIYWFLTI